MDYTGQIRRLDFNLRAHYPELSTEILQVATDKYVFYCTGVGIDLPAIQQYFEHSLCAVTMLSLVELSPTRHATYLATLLGLPDHEIAKDFQGILHSKITLLNLLLAKFPNVPFYDLTYQEDVLQIRTTTFETKAGDTTRLHFLNSADKIRVETFLRDLKLPLEFEIVETPNQSTDGVLAAPDLNPVQYIFAANAQRAKATPFALRDESIWYDNLDGIFAGTFKKEDLFFYNPNEYACYVDYSYDNIDLRNHLALFQSIYVTLPYEQDLAQWLGKRDIAKNEFLELVVRGRVKVVLTQPEFRYDIRFISDIYEANVEAVITRRALAALLQTDLVEIADNYLLNNPAILPELHNFCTLAAEKLGVDAIYLYDSLIWPIKARRLSFEALNSGGIFSTSTFGVNNFIQAHIKRSTGRDLAFEFSMAAANIHFANALNATYFPHHSEHEGLNDQAYASIMGESLNFYKNSTIARFKSLVDNNFEVESGIVPINPIDVITVDSFLTIDELERELSKEVIYPGGRMLMETLAALSPEGRKVKIDQYNQQLQQKRAKRGPSATQIDLGVNAAIDGIGLATGYPFLGTGYSLIKNGVARAGKLAGVKNILSTVDEALHGHSVDRNNIDFLTKISRVAKLRRTLP